MLGQSPRLLKVWSTLGDEEPAPLPLGVRVLSNRCADAGGVKERRERAGDFGDQLLWDPKLYS